MIGCLSRSEHVRRSGGNLELWTRKRLIVSKEVVLEQGEFLCTSRIVGRIVALVFLLLHEREGRIGVVWGTLRIHVLKFVVSDVQLTGQSRLIRARRIVRGVRGCVGWICGRRLALRRI